MNSGLECAKELEDRELAVRISAGAIERSKEFTSAVMVRGFEEVYREVVRRA